MSWNPNQGQDPNQQGQYGGYTPPPNPTPNPNEPYGAQQGGYQQGGYQQPPNPNDPYSAQQGGYQQPPPYGQQQYGGYQQPYGAPAGGTAAGAPGPTSMGMQANVAAGLSYVLGWVTGLVFFLVEKQNRFVRFHAMQSILFFGGITVLGIVLNIVWGVGIPFISFVALCINGLLGLVAFVGWIVLLINGFQGKYFKLPIIGDYAEKYANSNPIM
jgi:uncharacterized membrane protein